MKVALPKKQLIAIAVIIAIGLILAMLILTISRSDKDDDDAKLSTPAGTLPSAQRGQKAAASDPSTAPSATSRTNNLIVLSDAQVQAAGIQIDTVGAASIKNVQSLPGEIHFNEDRTARVVPRLAGVVESVSASLGQLVKKGQILATIASPAISDLRSELNTAQQRVALAKITYYREKMLWQEKISAEQDYLQAKQGLSEAQIALQNVQQKLQALGAAGSASSLNRHDIRAPFDGLVTEKRIALGDAVKEDTPVFQISDLSTVWADITVPATSLRWIRVGYPVTVKATQMPTTASGKITYVSALIGDQTRSATARVTLPNPQLQWRPGLFATIDVTTDEATVPITVATDAIQQIDGKPTVFVKMKEGFTAQPVVLGRTDGNRTAITSGLSSGAQYAAKNSFLIKAELGKGSAKDND